MEWFNAVGELRETAQSLVSSRQELSTDLSSASVRPDCLGFDVVIFFPVAFAGCMLIDIGPRDFSRSVREGIRTGGKLLGMESRVQDVSTSDFLTVGRAPLRDVLCGRRTRQLGSVP